MSEISVKPGWLVNILQAAVVGAACAGVAYATLSSRVSSAESGLVAAQAKLEQIERLSATKPEIENVLRVISRVEATMLGMDERQRELQLDVASIQQRLRMGDGNE